MRGKSSKGTRGTCWYVSANVLPQRGRKRPNGRVWSINGNKFHASTIGTGSDFSWQIAPRIAEHEFSQFHTRLFRLFGSAGLRMILCQQDSAALCHKQLETTAMPLQVEENSQSTMCFWSAGTDLSCAATSSNSSLTLSSERQVRSGKEEARRLLCCRLSSQGPQAAAGPRFLSVIEARTKRHRRKERRRARRPSP